MALYDMSIPGLWTSRLYEILRPAPNPVMLQFSASNSRSRYRHVPGEIWKHALCSSVYRDLAGYLYSFQDNLQHLSESPRSWRRFTRMDHIGLSGLVFYEIGVPACPVYAEQENVMEHYPDKLRLLTLKDVFGDPKDPSNIGMDVDELLDVLHAKVVFFPAYACTSFIVGQAMNSFLKNLPSIQPQPAEGGFSIPSPSIASSQHFPGTSSPALRGVWNPKHDLESGSFSGIPFVESSGRLSDLDDLSFFMEPDDPYMSLRIRQSFLADNESFGDSRHFSFGNGSDGTSTSSSDYIPPEMLSLSNDLNPHSTTFKSTFATSALDVIFSSSSNNLLSFLDFSMPKDHCISLNCTL